MEDDLDKQIQETQIELAKLISKNAKQDELNKLRLRLKKLTFQDKHKKLLNITKSIEKGTKGFFGGIGKTIKAVGKGLEKSDQYISKESAKEKELNKSKKKKSSINDELNFLN